MFVYYVGTIIIFGVIFWKINKINKKGVETKGIVKPTPELPFLS